MDCLDQKVGINSKLHEVTHVDLYIITSSQSNINAQKERSLVATTTKLLKSYISLIIRINFYKK